jgi:hypothetical protein
MTPFTDSNNFHNPLTPSPTVVETVAGFGNLGSAIGWAIEAHDDGHLIQDEFVSFCKDLEAHHDPYARSVSLTTWVEEVSLRRELARNFTDAA